MRAAVSRTFLRPFATAALALACQFTNSFPAFADAFQNSPGSIPLKYERQAASDLLWNGKRLLPDEARALYESGQIKDLTDLDPIADSVIWKNEMPKGALAGNDPMGINFQWDEFQYVSDTEAQVGVMSFIATKVVDGQLRSFQFLLDVKGHNVLLRKSLLRKIGYNIPPTGRLQKLKLHFQGAFSKKEFIRQINRYTNIEPERFVVGGAESEDSNLTLQDVIVFEGVTDPFYNLSRGAMVAQVIQGRRLFNSLLIPYVLTDAPQSVNLLPWEPGRIFNSQLVLPLDDAAEYTTPYEDARWILRRILKLSRHDWTEIVDTAQYPWEVRQVLIEKLISRRNFLRVKFGLEAESEEIAFNPEISAGPRLVQGKLVGQSWEGHAAHYAGFDPNNPLSGEELWGLFKSKAISNVITNLVGEFNRRWLSGTDLTAKIIDHQLSQSAKVFAHFIKTGEIKSVPFGVWATPYWNGQMISAREVVAGNYMGAENLVQLADVVGVAVDAGAYIGAHGIPSGISVDGRAKMSFVRTYTHLKPIQSIRASLKEPFRNMAVVWLKHSQANPLDEILKLEGLRGEGPGKLTDEEVAAKMEPLLKQFKDKLGVGESMIVQTSIAPEFAISAGYGFNDYLRAYVAFKDRLTALSRLHIFRKSETVIQVYRDPAIFNLMDVSFGFSAARMQVLNLGWGWADGRAKTEFFNIDLTSDLEANPKFFDNIAAIRRVLKWNSVDQLRRVQKPWVINHDFDEKTMHFNFLWWRHLKSNATDEIQVTHPEGAKKDFIRRTLGKRSGMNIESVSLEVLNSLTAEYLDIAKDIQLGSGGGGDPGDTFEGTSVARQTVLEGEVSSDRLGLDNLRLGIDYRWKGWDISRKKAQKILDEISRKYGTDLFPRHALTDTKEIKFYSVDISVALYREAVEKLLSLSEQEVTLLYTAYVADPKLPQEMIQAQRDQFAGYLRKIVKARAKGDVKDEADKLVKLVNHMESTLSFHGLIRAVGGIDRLFVNGSLRGFKVGEETTNAERDVFTHTLGQIGSFQPTGPLRQLQAEIGISEGELLIYWLLNRL